MRRKCHVKQSQEPGAQPWGKQSRYSDHGKPQHRQRRPTPHEMNGGKRILKAKGPEDRRENQRCDERRGNGEPAQAENEEGKHEKNRALLCESRLRPRPVPFPFDPIDSQCAGRAVLRLRPEANARPRAGLGELDDDLSKIRERRDRHLAGRPVVQFDLENDRFRSGLCDGEHDASRSLNRDRKLKPSAPSHLPPGALAS